MAEATPSTKIVLAGLGGQGVVFATRLLAEAAVLRGLPVIASETHGMSQRGGSVLSHLKIGGTEAPLIRRGTADFLLALDPDEAVRNLAFLRPGGVALVNSAAGLRPEVAERLPEFGLAVHTLPATRMAMDLAGAPVANVVLIGFALAHPAFPLRLEEVRAALDRLAKRGRDANRLALQAGYDAGGMAFHRRQGTPSSAEAGR